MKRLIRLFLLLIRPIIPKIRKIVPPMFWRVARSLILKVKKLRKEYRANIYPVKIPRIKFLPDQDLILLELPQRYIPMIPNGLGYVNNILKLTGVHFQTVDLNIICYHRYHSRRILCGLNKVVSASGYVMKDDPWDNVNSDEWSKPEVIEYFYPEINEIINGLAKARPKIIGISLSGTNRHIAGEIVKGIRKIDPDVIILVGGYDCVYPTVGPYLFPNYDYMVIGEAELTLGPLVKALVAGEKPKDMPGIISRYDSPNRDYKSGPYPQDLDATDFPRYDWIDINLYRSYKGEQQTVPIISSRGCRWSRCRFCAECFLWRNRDPKKVVDEIEWWVEQGFRIFRFNESDMNGKPDALLEICDEILRRRLKISFHGELRIHKCGTREFFKRLQASGCNYLVFGVDGWTDHTLCLQSKGYTMDLVEKNLCNCHQAGIYVAVNIVIGVPGETEEDVQESIDNILKNKWHIDDFQNLNILILAAGSEYYKNPERYNIHFRGEKQELYEKHPYFIPPDLWYSINPYIDYEIRLNRRERIYTGLVAGGMNITSYAKWQVKGDSQ